MTSTARAASTRVDISLEDRSYPILIGAGLLDQTSTWEGLPRAATALIVTNDVVGPLYLERLQRALQPHYPRVLNIVLPDGEAHKTWETLKIGRAHV